jgi:dihydropteroate synthase
LAPQYQDVVREVMAHLLGRVRMARKAGVVDIVLDPGFGFGKTLEHNYALFRALPQFAALGLPLLVGISRKSMIWKLAGASPLEVDDLSAALHLQALLAGASLLRVHDVPAAMRVLSLHQALEHGAV